MKINIYYGGRGLLEDPTLPVIAKMTEELKELRVEVSKYNLFEEKQGINVLPKTLKEADGIILATTVEWMGIGGYMQQFLDACWFYGDKEKLQNLYMLPVVLSTTYGEREALLLLENSWNMLGGKMINGICAYVEDHVMFEANRDYTAYIESITENLYRNVNKKQIMLPNSQAILNQNVLSNKTIELTPQESEQLSMFASDDSYLKKQKEDLEELSSIFKEMLGERNINDDDLIIKLKKGFTPVEGVTVKYAITLKDKEKQLNIEVSSKVLNCYFGEIESPDVVAQTSSTVMNQIVDGKLTFQKGFLTGQISAKGDFKMLRSFDSVFRF